MAFDRFVSFRYTGKDGRGFEANPWRGLARLPERPQLEIDFEVTKSIAYRANTARITARNLSPDQRSQLVLDRPTSDAFDLPLSFIDRRLGGQGRGTGPTAQAVGVGYVELVAGYDGRAPVIFEGSVREGVSDEGSSPTITTTIHAGDGEVNLGAACLNRVFEPGATYQQIVNYIAETLNVDLASDVDPSKGGILPEGLRGSAGGTVSMSGAPDQVLSQLAKGLDFGWWIEDGELVLIGETGYRSAYTLTADVSRNMIGLPERIGPDSLRVTVQLAPEAKIASRVQVISPTISGTFRLEGIDHRGTNAAGVFQTLLRLRNLDFLQTL